MSLAMSLVIHPVKSLQSFISFTHCTSPAFSTERAVGRTGLLGLGVGLTIGISSTLTLTLLILSPSSPALVWSLYLLILSLFHALEFLTTALFNPTAVTATSFVVDHSLAYTMALLSSFLELAVRTALGYQGYQGFLAAPSLSRYSLPGLALCVGGQFIRSLAMCTCADNFNHIIQTSDTKETHNLVQHGIYKHLRHPSYFGWFYWSIGTQLLLLNPVNSLLYAAASYRFFKERIPYEEDTLFDLFGEDYAEYRERSYIGIPGIKEGKKGQRGAKKTE
jgi:protein-S-isoprenylcysteine O-methyltransferase